MKHLVAALLLGLSSASGAAPYAIGEAEIEWRSRPQDKIIVDETIWRCEGELCRGKLVDSAFMRLRTCYKLATHAGRVVALRTASGSLSQEDIARCNKER